MCLRTLYHALESARPADVGHTRRIWRVRSRAFDVLNCWADQSASRNEWVQLQTWENEGRFLADFVEKLGLHGRLVTDSVVPWER